MQNRADRQRRRRRRTGRGPTARAGFGLGAVLAVSVLTMLAGCSSGGSATTTETTTASVTVQVTRTVPTTVVPTVPAPPSTVPTVGPGTEVGAQSGDMQYGSAKVNPLQPCTVVDSDAGDLVGLPLQVSTTTPNNCGAYRDGKGFGFEVHVGDMADAIAKPKRCAYAQEEQDQCDFPEIVQSVDARTFVQDGVTVIERDYPDPDADGSGMLTADVAIAKNAWVELSVFYDADGGLTAEQAGTVRDTLVGQMIDHAQG